MPVNFKMHWSEENTVRISGAGATLDGKTAKIQDEVSVLESELFRANRSDVIIGFHKGRLIWVQNLMVTVSMGEAKCDKFE